MVRLQFSVQLAYDVLDDASDFVFNIQAAKTQCQTVVDEHLAISQTIDPIFYTEPVSGNRMLRLQARRGSLVIRYQATVDIRHRLSQPEQLYETPIADLPSEAFAYLYPSRYCESDRLIHMACREFGTMEPGYGRVLAIQKWVQQHVSFHSGISCGTTSATETLVERAGVCRDYAHLMIALCRALNIPARFASGIDYGADPTLGPPDFHAYVEVMLSGRWYLFDASGVTAPMGLIRIGTGRDASDTAFATIFGNVSSYAPLIEIDAFDDSQRGIVIPVHCEHALSTADCDA